NPLANYFTLESAPPTDGKWQQVWQHIDMQRYIKSVPFELKPYIVRLDAKSPVGGFSRNWPAPGNRVITHLGYAYQWFGFALTLFVIYIVLNFKKVKR
ncbi:MAG: SURF1 family cytochrome oxidase biogenesis protein, partial [Methylophilaceae bacterium]